MVFALGGVLQFWCLWCFVGWYEYRISGFGGGWVWCVALGFCGAAPDLVLMAVFLWCVFCGMLILLSLGWCFGLVVVFSVNLVVFGVSILGFGDCVVWSAAFSDLAGYVLFLRGWYNIGFLGLCMGCPGVGFVVFSADLVGFGWWILVWSCRSEFGLVIWFGVGGLGLCGVVLVVDCVVWAWGGFGFGVLRGIIYCLGWV